MQQNAPKCITGKNHASVDGGNSLPCHSLKETQARAIDLLLQGLSDTDVASQLDVARSTIFRWRKKEHFARRLRTFRERLFEQSAARIQNLVQPSLEILTRQLNSSDEKLALRAAAILLRLATNARLCGHESPTRKPKGKRADKPLEITPEMEALEAFINAPMPGQATSSGLTPKFKW